MFRDTPSNSATLPFYSFITAFYSFVLLPLSLCFSLFLFDRPLISSQKEIKKKQKWTVSWQPASTKPRRSKNTRQQSYSTAQPAHNCQDVECRLATVQVVFETSNSVRLLPWNPVACLGQLQRPMKKENGQDGIIPGVGILNFI